MNPAVVTQELFLEDSTMYRPYKRQRAEAKSKTSKSTYKTASKIIEKARKSEFTKNVKAVISAMTETKRAFHKSGDTMTMFNSGIDSNGDVLQVLPNIAQGTTDGQRVGEQIRAQSLNVRGYVKLNINSTDNSTKLPTVAVRLMCCAMKNRPCYTDAYYGGTQLATLLQKGTTTVGFTGVLSDLYAPINTEAFTVYHDEVIYLNQTYVAAIGASQPSSRVPIDAKETTKFFDFWIKCKNKKLLYDEDVGGGINPTNFGPFLCLGYVYLDGSSPDTLSTNVGMQYDSIFKYEDA